MNNWYEQYKHAAVQRTYINVRGQYEGFHAYENAPDQVAFLKNSHRHIFKWRVTIQVFGTDRELEFFIVKSVLEREILAYTRLKSNLGSCEQQAEEILKGLVNAYGPHRQYMVRVSEDGENDGFVMWHPRDLPGGVSGVREVDAREETKQDSEHSALGDLIASERAPESEISYQERVSRIGFHHHRGLRMAGEDSS